MEAEESVVGAAIGPFASRVLPELSEILSPSMFSLPSLGAVFAAALAVHGRGSPVDAILVGAELERSGTLGLLPEGRATLVHLVGQGALSSSAVAHARRVAEVYHRCELALAAELLREAAVDGDAESTARALDELSRVWATSATDRSHLLPGGTFALDVPVGVPAVWGVGDKVLAAKGEPTCMVGPPGTGKTALAQELAKARIGLLESVLGLPVDTGERVLYMACDRPAQARRSLRRMVTESHRAELDERLLVWTGPPSFDLCADRGALLRFARQHGADTVIVDSLKDVAADLIKDEVGTRVNAAFQETVAGGVEVVFLHHQRKALNGGSRPRKLDDVYGSAWITAGAGSVILLWGDAGDPIVELVHLKQPSEEVGPLQVLHDAATGGCTVVETPDAYSVLSRAAKGITAAALAVTLTGHADPERKDVEKARRSLERLVAEGKAHKRDGAKGGSRGGDAATYFSVDKRREGDG